MVVTIPTNATGTIFLGEFLYADNTVPEDLAAKTLPADIYLFDDDGLDYSNPGNDIRETGIPMTRTYVGGATYNAVNAPMSLNLSTWFPIGFAQYSYLNNKCRGADYWSGQGYTFLDQIYREFRNVTDHNGYTWIPIRKWRYGPPAVPLLFKWRLAVVSVSGNGVTPSGTVDGFVPNTAYSLSNINVTNLTVVNDLEDNKWYPSVSGDFSLTAAALTSEVFVDVTGPEYRSYVIGNVNPDPDVSNYIKTTVKGAVLENGTNTPVDNVSVVITNGGWTRTANGDWQVVLHGAMNKNFIIGNNDNDRVEDRPIFGWNGACAVSWFGGSAYGNLLNIYRYLVGQQYSMNIPYLYGNSFIIQQVGINGPFLKRWGLYDVGIIGVDQHGNPTPVQLLKQFEIPGINDDLHEYDPIKYPLPGTYRRGNATINWSINSPVPVPEFNRFRYFQFVITPEQSTDRFLQWAPATVLYVSRWDSAGNVPVVSGYGTNATEIYLSMGDTFQRFREINADSATVSTGTTLNQFGQVGWSYQPGDRVRIITKYDGTYQSTPIDVELIGQRGVYLVINNDNSIPEMFGGELIELYRPGKTPGEAKYYNEVVGVQAVVSDPFGNPDWVNSSGTTAAGTAIMGADAWGLATSIPIRPGYINPTDTPNLEWRSRIYFRQSMSITDFWPSKVDALGRVAIEDPQATQRRRGTIVRVGNSYMPGTSRNGLRLFEPLNNKVANTDYGLIMHLEEMDQVVVCPCSGSRTFAIYLSRTLVTSGDTDLITIGGSILGTMRPMAWRYGTVNPESIVRGDTFMFWVDALAGAVVRYDVNGVKSISKRGLGNWFARYCRGIVKFDNYRFYGGINQEFSEYLITTKLVQRIENGIDIDAGGDTLAFWFANSEESAVGNKWSCFMDWTPEYYGRSAGKMFSMKNGAVHLHDADPDNQNTVYGVKFPMSVDMLFNNDPVIKKVFLAVQANNGPGWYSPSIVTPEGQRSNLIEADYVNDEGVAKAGLLRDINTPVSLPLTNGDPLRSAALTVRFSNDADNGKAILNSAGIHYRTSPET